MRPRHPPTLTEGQIRVLEHLWPDPPPRARGPLEPWDLRRAWADVLGCSAQDVWLAVRWLQGER